MKKLVLILLALTSSNVFSASLYEYCPNQSEYSKCSKNVNYTILMVRRQKFKEEMRMKRKIAELNAQQPIKNAVYYK